MQIKRIRRSALAAVAMLAIAGSAFAAPGKGHHLPGDHGPRSHQHGFSKPDSSSHPALQVIKKMIDHMISGPKD